MRAFKSWEELKESIIRTTGLSIIHETWTQAEQSVTVGLGVEPHSAYPAKTKVLFTLWCSNAVGLHERPGGVLFGDLAARTMWQIGGYVPASLEDLTD